MSLDLVSAWQEDDPINGDRVVLVTRKDGRPKFHTTKSKWTIFVEGVGQDVADYIGRDPGVVGTSFDGPYLRIDCKHRGARWKVVDWLERFQEFNQKKGGPEVKILEADVKPVRRLLSDNPHLEISETPRLIYLDIEVDSRKSIAEQKEGLARIVSWAICDADGVTNGMVLAEDTDAAERDLMETLFERIWNYDCVVAWYGDGYDFEVIENRTTALRCKFRIPYRKGKSGIPFHRWTWLDHLEVFKKYNLNSDDGGEAKSSYALNHVAKHLLGEGKLDFDSSKTWEAWEDDPDALLAYNVQDTALLPRIEAKTGFIALHLAVCHICRVFPDTSSLNATQQGDGFLLRLGDEYGYRWATKRRFDDAPEPFEGAFVMEPTRYGAIDSVHVCDFSGLYPSIIRTFNMGPDTKVHEHEPDFIDHDLNVDSKELIKRGIAKIPNRKTYFRQEHDSMFRIALDRLVAKRAEYQAEMKKHTPGTPEHSRAKRLQGAFKIVANSFYGILGSPWSRFFDTAIAEGVTVTGKWLLWQVIEEAKTRGLDPFYGDTDSVFVAGDGDEMERLVRHMNETWPERLAQWGIVEGRPMHVDLDFEKTFSRIVLISAKRYAGRFIRYKGKDASPDAKPEVKGLEFKRGDTLRLARELQVEVVNLLLGIGEPFDTPLPAARESRKIVDRWKAHVLHDDLDPDDIILSQGLTKKIEEYSVRYTTAKCKKCEYSFPDQVVHGTRYAKCPECSTPRKKTTPPMHVRVATQMRDDGHDLVVGDRIRYIVARPDRFATDRKPVPIPTYAPGAMERIDREYYWKRVGDATIRVLKKVYPSEKWTEHAADKKSRELKRRQAEMKGVVEDLPIFSHFGVSNLTEDDTTAPRSTTAPRTTRGPRPMKIRQRKKRVKKKETAEPSKPAVPAAAPRERRRRRRKKVETQSIADEGPPRRVRRRRRPKVFVRLVEQTAAEAGGAESIRRRRFLEHVREVAEAHPGSHDLAIHIVFPEDIWSEDNPKMIAKVTIPTGLTVDPEAFTDAVKVGPTSKIFVQTRAPT